MKKFCINCENCNFSEVHLEYRELKIKGFEVLNVLLCQNEIKKGSKHIESFVQKDGGCSEFAPRITPIKKQSRKRIKERDQAKPNYSRCGINYNYYQSLKNEQSNR